MQRRGPSNTGATGCQCHCVMFKLKHGLLSAHKFCFSLKHVRTFFCNFTENDYCQETPAHNIQPWQHDQNACPTLVVMAFRFWSVNFALMVGTLKQIHQYNGANLNSQGQGKRRKKQIYIPVVFYHLVMISFIRLCLLQVFGQNTSAAPNTPSQQGQQAMDAAECFAQITFFSLLKHR